jgi:hypothetical protein
MAAGAGLMAIDKTGGFTDASKGLGKGRDALNTIASFALPGAGWFTKKTDSFRRISLFLFKVINYSSSSIHLILPDLSAIIFFARASGTFS